MKDNPFLINKEETNKKMKKNRLTMNLNDLLNKTDEENSNEEKKSKKNNRLTINLKETIECLNNDDSSDGSINIKCDPQQYLFSTNVKNCQSTSKISISPININKEKLWNDVCLSSASKKLNYSEKLINTDFKENIKDSDHKYAANDHYQDNIRTDSIILNEIKEERDQNIIIKDTKEDQIRFDTQIQVFIGKNLEKNNFSEIIEVDEANYSKSSGDTPTFPYDSDNKKDLINKYRETFDLNHAIQLQKNSDSFNNSVNCVQLKNNIMLSSTKKENYMNKYNVLPKNLPQSLSNLFSPTTKNILKNSSIANQMISPVKESRSLNFDSISREKDVKKRLSVYLQYIDETNAQNERNWVENQNDIKILNESIISFKGKKDKIIKEKFALDEKYEILCQEENLIKEQIKVVNNVFNMFGICIDSTENYQLQIKILKNIRLIFFFKEFDKKLIEDENSSLELVKVTMKFEKKFIINLKQNLKLEILNVFDELINFCFGTICKINFVKMNFRKFCENLKKMIKYSSNVLYLTKCLIKASVACHDASISFKTDDKFLNKKAKVNLQFLNKYGIFNNFVFEIEVFNSFYIIILLDLSMDIFTDVIRD